MKQIVLNQYFLENKDSSANDQNFLKNSASANYIWEILKTNNQESEDENSPPKQPENDSSCIEPISDPSCF